MVPIQIDDIVDRLLDLRAYSPQLSRPMEHEEELPEDATLFLINRLEQAYARAEAATERDRAEAYDELALWLVKSFKFYAWRLLLAGNDQPWCFSFPKSQGHTHH